MKNFIKLTLYAFWIFYFAIPVNSSLAFDPCDWGPIGRVYERVTWGGTDYNRKVSRVCPPWNRLKGRGGCIRQYDPPGNFNLMYNKYCAEESTQSKYFDPKIHVRIQTCNVACWNLSKHLSGDGQCMVFPGALGIPTTRLCARVAVPASPEVGTPADHGYTYGYHLDHEGALKIDPIPEGVNGEPIYYARPKVCAYWDPSFWDSIMNYASIFFTGPAGAVFATVTILDALLPEGQGNEILSNEENFILATGVSEEDIGYHKERASVARGLQSNFQPDLWDLNPVKQSVHFHEDGIFFLFQMLIQLVKMGIGISDMIVQLVESLPAGLKYLVYILSKIFWIIQALAYIGEEVMIPILEYFGQFNNVVGAAIGCVLISLGPYPPPYCSEITVPPASPQIQEICKTTIEGTESPDSVNKCVESRIINNAIRNSVRIGYNTSMPICKSDQTPGDICVKVHPTSANGRDPANASLIYAMTNNTGLVSVCDESNSNMPCVESPYLVQKCNEDREWCDKGIRLIYTTTARGLTPTIKHYYDSTMSDCGVAGAACQDIWGVNIGDFVDLTATFPVKEEGYNIEDLESEPVDITRNDGEVQSLRLLIPREAKTHDVYAKDVEPTSMYIVNQLDQIVGSVERASAPKPTIYNCGSEGINCTSDHLRPAMVVKIQIGTDITKGALSTDTYFDDPRPRNTLGNSELNLAGHDYTTFVTDSDLTQKPFDGDRAINPTTLVGEYLGGVVPYDIDGNLLPGDHIYMGGLEYYADQYKMGGELMCLSGYQFADCFTSESTENCVLTKFTNSDYVKCTDFLNNIVPRYPSLGLCSQVQVDDYVDVETIRVRSPVSGTIPIFIKKDADTLTYCYDYPRRVERGKLCESSRKIEDRLQPRPNLGIVLPDRLHYNYDKGNPPNPDTLSVRNKTPLEHGLCVNVPSPPKCPATRGRRADWPETPAGSSTVAPGDSVTGNEPIARCVDGNFPRGEDALKRYCSFNLRNGRAKWDRLDSSKGCIGCNGISTFVASTYNSRTKELVLSNPGAGHGIYQYSFKFNISDVSQVSRFKYISGGADDSFQVKINGNIVAFAPEWGYSPGHEYRRYSESNQRNVNLKRFLVDGDNEIIVDLSIRGLGRLDTRFILDIDGCNNIRIDN